MTTRSPTLEAPPEPTPPPARSKEYRLPPGLKHSLPFYSFKPWVKLGHPIRLFEHLLRTYGNIAHYRFLGTPIVFLNDPDYIREILINQASSLRQGAHRPPHEDSPRRRPHHLRRSHPHASATHRGACLPPSAHRRLRRPDRHLRRHPTKILAAQPAHRHRGSQHAALAGNRSPHPLQHRGHRRHPLHQRRSQHHHGPLPLHHRVPPP